MAVQYVSYDKHAQELTVSFPEKNATYVYRGVASEVAEGFRLASAVGVSDGQYFQHWIKNHAHTRLR